MQGRDDVAPGPAVEMHVIATTDEGTLSALAEAKRRLRGVDAGRIVLLVPQPVSYAAPIAPEEATAISEQYRELATSAGVDAVVRVCFCRRCDDAFRWMLRKRSLIVMGGRQRWWWPTAAQQMARSLKKAGHDVVFAAL
jgi:hypothetical protein